MRKRSGTANLNPYGVKTSLHQSLQAMSPDTGVLLTPPSKPLQKKIKAWLVADSPSLQEWREQMESLVAELCREAIDKITQALTKNSAQQALADIIEPPVKHLVFQLLHVSDFFPDDEFNDIAGKFSLYNLAAIELLSLCYPEIHNANTQTRASTTKLQTAYQTHMATQETASAADNHHELELLLLGKLTKQYDGFPAQTDLKQKRRFPSSKKNMPLAEATETAEQAQTLINGIYINSSIYYLTAYDVKLMHQLAAQNRFADRPDEDGTTILMMLADAFEGDDENKLIDDLSTMIESVLPMINTDKQQSYLSSADSGGKNLVGIALEKKLGRTALYLATTNKALEKSLKTHLAKHNLTQVTLLVECYAKDQNALITSLEKIDLSQPTIDQRFIATLFAKHLYRAAVYVATQNTNVKTWVDSRLNDLPQSPLNDKQLLALIDAEILAPQNMLELTLQKKGRTDSAPYSLLDDVSLLARLVHAAGGKGSIAERINLFDDEWDYPDNTDYQQQMMTVLEKIFNGSYLPTLVGGSMPRTAAQQAWHAVLFADEGPLSEYLQHFEHGKTIIQNAKHYAEKLTAPSDTAALAPPTSNLRRQTYNHQSLRAKGPKFSFKRGIEDTKEASVSHASRAAYVATLERKIPAGPAASPTATPSPT